MESNEDYLIECFKYKFRIDLQMNNIFIDCNFSESDEINQSLMVY